MSQQSSVYSLGSQVALDLSEAQLRGPIHPIGKFHGFIHDITLQPADPSKNKGVQFIVEIHPSPGQAGVTDGMRITEYLDPPSKESAWKWFRLICAVNPTQTPESIKARIPVGQSMVIAQILPQKAPLQYEVSEESYKDKNTGEDKKTRRFTPFIPLQNAGAGAGAGAGAAAQGGGFGGGGAQQNNQGGFGGAGAQQQGGFQQGAAQGGGFQGFGGGFDPNAGAQQGGGGGFQQPQQGGFQQQGGGGGFGG